MRETDVKRGKTARVHGNGLWLGQKKAPSVITWNVTMQNQLGTFRDPRESGLKWDWLSENKVINW